MGLGWALGGQDAAGIASGSMQGVRPEFLEATGWAASFHPPYLSRSTPPRHLGGGPGGPGCSGDRSGEPAGGRLLPAGASAASRKGVGRATLTLRCAGAAAGAPGAAGGGGPAPSAPLCGSKGLSRSVLSWGG